MAVAARQLSRETQRRPQLTLVPGTGRSRSSRADSGKSSGASKAKSSEAVYRDVLRVAISVLVLGVIFGMSLVFLTTEAARLSKETDIVMQDIKREADRTQQLQMARYQVASAQQIELVATQVMGMVPVNGDVTVVDVGGPTTDVAGSVAATTGKTKASEQSGSKSSGWLSRVGSTQTLARLAELTSGEAQVLLVGDIGLTAAR